MIVIYVIWFISGYVNLLKLRQSILDTLIKSISAKQHIDEKEAHSDTKIIFVPPIRARDQSIPNLRSNTSTTITASFAVCDTCYFPIGALPSHIEGYSEKQMCKVRQCGLWAHDNDRCCGLENRKDFLCHDHRAR